MRQPCLYFNNYYPFYTQTKIGKKSYYYKITTVMHLSEDRAIVIKLDYDLKKIKEIELEVISDRKKLYDLQKEAVYISYVDFSDTVKTFFFQLKKSLRSIVSEKAYHKKMVFSSLFKFNSTVEFELGFRSFKIIFGKYDYQIIDNKKVIKQKLATVISLEEDSLLHKVGRFLDAYESKINYFEIDDKEFNNKLNDNWEYFLPYFEAPKFIRKKEYKI